MFRSLRKIIPKFNIFQISNSLIPRRVTRKAPLLVGIAFSSFFFMSSTQAIEDNELRKAKAEL